MLPMPARDSISVIICTHNPRAHYFRRVLDAVRAQTLSFDTWELLIVDNVSDQPLSDIYDIAWHPRARHVREEETGLTAARLRGITESSGELLVFFDDDNVPSTDYLSAADELRKKHPHIGAFGASIVGEFEVRPPAWAIRYIPGLAVHELDRDYWSNLEQWSLAVPYGAGLCVRRDVATSYYNKCSRGNIRRSLDRAGKGVGSGGDTDFALCAIDLGLGTARFTSLRLTHLISAERLNENYLIKLHAGFSASQEILASLRGVREETGTGLKEMVRFGLEVVLASPMQRKLLLASRRARAEARRLLRRHETAR
jgi:glycosyltransferase involved in cell wall biosynthesis